MPFHLRAATLEDAAAIAALIALSVRALQSLDYSPAQINASLETIFTVDSTMLADATYFVAFSDDGQLAGCGGWSRRKTLYGGDRQIETAEPALLDPATDAAKIRAIFVHPHFARQGLGSLILDAAETAAAKEGFTRLEMGSTLTGVALYSLRGYSEVERLSVPVGRGQSIAVVKMIKQLRP
jgi:GNAT superfamily N-acetyltransferase